MEIKMRKIISKRAEMSLTVVVAAVLALVVLIVLIYIFMNSSKNASSTFGNCEISGGNCNIAKGASCPSNSFPISATCTDTTKQCCSNPDILKTVKP